MKTTEESALQKMEDFGPQQTANTLHIIAKTKMGGESRGVDDGAAGGAGRGDIRGVQLGGCCKHAVVGRKHTLYEYVRPPPSDLFFLILFSS
jgi:hypothetical protein